VNALVRDVLGRYMETRSRRLAALAQFEAVADGRSSASSAIDHEQRLPLPLPLKARPIPAQCRMRDW
jgi:hypothetical protein